MQLLAGAPRGTRDSTVSAEHLLAEVEEGGLDHARASHLIRATGSDLLALLSAASHLRDRHRGGVVTYSRKVFIPLTNLCRDKCGYCTFAKPPGDGDAHAHARSIARAGRARAARKRCSASARSPKSGTSWRASTCARWAELTLAWEGLQQALYPELDFTTSGGRRYSCQAPQTAPGVIPAMPVPAVQSSSPA